MERLKAAGYYQEAIERIDAYLAEDWTVTQNSPRSQARNRWRAAAPEPHAPRCGGPAGRDAGPAGDHAPHPGRILLHRGRSRGPDAGLVRDFTREEFRLLVKEGRVDWRFVEGEKHYLDRFAETLLATHADLAARQIDPPAPALRHGSSATASMNRWRGTARQAPASP